MYDNISGLTSLDSVVFFSRREFQDFLKILLKLSTFDI